MDLSALLEKYKNCPCGKEHVSVIKAVEIDNGVVHEVGKILSENGFPKKILLVSDEPAFAAADGIMESLEKSGFSDYSNFFKAFTKAVGISPKKYAGLSVS